MISSRSIMLTTYRISNTACDPIFPFWSNSAFLGKNVKQIYTSLDIRVEVLERVHVLLKMIRMPPHGLERLL